MKAMTARQQNHDETSSLARPTVIKIMTSLSYHGEGS